VKVLFVCSGNICRSPMAAEYFRHRAAHAGLSHVVVDSAGTLGIEGQPAAAEAVEVLRGHGLDLRRHRSRGIRLSDLRTSDLVVVMELAHQDFLEALDPSLRGRIALLRSFEPGSKTAASPDLDDPIGGDAARFEGGFETIRSCIEGLVLHLKHAP
jgi:protein-tyrosine phosphatase